MGRQARAKGSVPTRPTPESRPDQPKVYRHANAIYAALQDLQPRAGEKRRRLTPLRIRFADPFVAIAETRDGRMAVAACGVEGNVRVAPQSGALHQMARARLAEVFPGDEEWLPVDAVGFKT